MATVKNGVEPVTCQFCQAKCARYVDGKTRMGPWAEMCLPCHKKNGVGLGTGKGQQYEPNDAGDDYVKTAG